MRIGTDRLLLALFFGAVATVKAITAEVGIIRLVDAIAVAVVDPALVPTLTGFIAIENLTLGAGLAVLGTGCGGFTQLTGAIAADGG